MEGPRKDHTELTQTQKDKHLMVPGSTSSEMSIQHGAAAESGKHEGIIMGDHERERQDTGDIKGETQNGMGLKLRRRKGSQYRRRRDK